MRRKDWDIVKKNSSIDTYYKMRNTWKSLIFISIIIIIIPFLSSLSLAYETPECKYGTFDVWYSKDGVKWQDTTVDYAELKRGEPFYIKATVGTKIDSAWVALRIWETGISSAGKSSFEVIDGPCDMYKSFDLGEIPKKDSSSTYIWKLCVRPGTNWTNGNAPLNIRAQFDRKVNGEWQSDDISFTAVNVYILDELWDGYASGNVSFAGGNNRTNSAPGFGISLFMMMLVLFLMWKRKDN